MKILNKLSVAGKTMLTLDGDILDINPSKVIVDGKEFDFDIAYDMKNTIGIDAVSVSGDTVSFMQNEKMK